MKRIIDHYLIQWKSDHQRQPLLLRGARQVGKTYAVRQLGKTYDSFVEINLEFNEHLHYIFQETHDPAQIIMKLMVALKKDITPGKTLLFLDEIQVLPRVIIILRYFYELMPDLHVIAAGSLLDFAIEQVGVPVGRIQAMYMQPISFIEYCAYENPFACAYILKHVPDKPIEDPIHTICLELLSKYLAVGGMPKSVQAWADYHKPLEISKVHARILDMYQQDFEKYARTHQIKYVTKIFEQIPKQLGQKFKYSLVDGEYRKRELAPALDLLITAGIAKKVHYSAGQGTPLGAQTDDSDYKVIFLDVGLAQTLMNAFAAEWLLQPTQEFVNKGQLVEAFVGQELAMYADLNFKSYLYYWHKDSAPQAEIDYLAIINSQVIPVEVKSGKGSTLKSLHYFLQTHQQSPYGIKFSVQDYSTLYDAATGHLIYNYPLYAIAKVMSDHNPDMRAAMESLLS